MHLLLFFHYVCKADCPAGTLKLHSTLYLEETTNGNIKMILSAVCCKQFIDKLLTQHKTIVKVKFLSKCNSNFNQIFFKKLKKK